MPAPRLPALLALGLGLVLHISSPLLFAGIGDNPDIETVFQFTLAPAGVTCSTSGLWMLGVNQSEKARLRAVQVAKNGDVTPFPDDKMGLGDVTASTPLDAVEALQTDADGIIWMLDNGRRSEVPPKLVGWNPDKKRVQQVLYFAMPAIVPGSFLADFAIDPISPIAIISDPASGTNAALLVLDRATGISRRFLQGHPALKPDPAVPLRATRTGKETRRLDGSFTVPHCGVRPLVMDRKGQWLYFAAVQSRSVYRLPMALLRSPDLNDEKLVKALEHYADKPAAASLAIDNKNNLYVGDIEGRGIGTIDPEKRGYKMLFSDARLVWPDGLCFGIDGKLYFVSRSQASVSNSRDSTASTVEHSMFRIQPLAPGVPGG